MATSAQTVNCVLHVLYMNARSLKKNIQLQENQYISHLSKFQELLYLESVDIMFVTETRLNSNVSNIEILHNGCNIYRTDVHGDKLEEFLLQSSMVFSSVATKFLPFLLQMQRWLLLNVPYLITRNGY